MTSSPQTNFNARLHSGTEADNMSVKRDRQTEN